jgi:hypothetical protein
MAFSAEFPHEREWGWTPTTQQSQKLTQNGSVL